MPLIAAIFFANISTHFVNAQTHSLTNAQLAQRLERPVTVEWEGQRLAAALERLAEVHQIALWIDRRIDPATPIELSMSQQPLREVLSAIGAPHDWSFTTYHGVLYFGPRETASELATLRALARQTISKAPADRRAPLLTAEPWSFPRLSEPRQLLVQLARQARVELKGEELVPHDLWPARSLPPLPVVDRVVLLLAGFDLTCQLSADGSQLQIVPIKRPVHITSTYTISRARSAAVDAVLKELPAAKATRAGQQLTLSALAEEHERVQLAIKGQPAPTPARPPLRSTDESQQRFTLKITNQPVGRVIDQLAKQLKLDVEWPPELSTASATTRTALVSCDVRDADLDELLTAVLSPAGLSFERDGQKVRIRVAR
jgi:hypothetical protein